MERGQALIRLLLIAGIAALVTFGAIRLFSGLFSSSDEAVPEEEIVQLTDYIDTDAVATMIWASPVRSDEEYREIQVSVTRDYAILEVVQGYEGNVIASKEVENNQASFEVFMRAIELEGFMESREADPDDDRGVCPRGNRYIFDLSNDGERISRLWSTSCNRRHGNLAGDRTDLQRVFLAQIPDYKEITREVDIK